MKLISPLKRTISLSILGLLVFAFGFATTPSYACTRIQANCTYTVDGYICRYDGCRGCDQFGVPCCYYEYGHCNDDPHMQGSSQICYGLCDF